VKRKLFLAGYLDDKIYPDCDEINSFNQNANVYTFEEVLQLGFIEGIVDIYEDWDELTKMEQITLMLEYAKNDELADVKFFDTEIEAEHAKNNVLD
jgi:hypothetical protein